MDHAARRAQVSTRRPPRELVLRCTPPAPRMQFSAQGSLKERPARGLCSSALLAFSDSVRRPTGSGTSASKEG
eukprot:11149119-Alexandrium_andersonii.AAC.1